LASLPQQRKETFKNLRLPLSKILPRLSSEQKKNEENKVKGCESAVWAYRRRIKTGYPFTSNAAADAKTDA